MRCPLLLAVLVTGSFENVAVQPKEKYEKALRYAKSFVPAQIPRSLVDREPDWRGKATFDKALADDKSMA